MVIVCLFVGVNIVLVSRVFLCLDDVNIKHHRISLFPSAPTQDQGQRRNDNDKDAAVAATATATIGQPTGVMC